MKINDKNMFRELFYIPRNHDTEDEVTYLCGHSLGLQPRSIKSAVDRELDTWREVGVEGHFKEESQWFNYHKRLSLPLANLIGAKESEVIAMNSLTVNLHLMLVSFYNPTKKRYKIITDAPCFPSDKYCLDSQITFHNLDPKETLIKINTINEDGSLISIDQLCSIIEQNKESVSLVFLNPLNYLSGQFFDISALSSLCQKYEIILGLGLAHTIGNVPINIHDAEVDFAIWCSYKYLNGSPGSIGGCFIHEKYHNKKNLTRFEGWWGSNILTRFEMRDYFEPIPTAEAWQLSNPPILVMAALKAATDIFDQTDIVSLANRSQVFTSYFEDMILESVGIKKIQILNNKNYSRGNMISMKLQDKDKLPHIKTMFNKNNIIVDYRQPDIIRASFCPLYNNKEDIDKLVGTIKKSL